MRQLADEEQERQEKIKADRYAMVNLIDKDRTMKPIDLLKNSQFRRQVQCSFNSTTRANWQQAHASKTNPPRVGKYRPNYS